MSALQNQQYKKDFPGNLGVDKAVTNASTRDCVTPLGTTIGAGKTVTITAYEWSLIPTGTRTAFQLS
jgi:uncharacterized membrane protein